MKDDRRAVLVNVTGQVQGVSYRAWACAEARRSGLSGWVRNEADGSVTALLVGPDTMVTAMVGRLRQGPPSASVSNIVSRETTLQKEPVGFTIVA